MVVVVLVVVVGVVVVFVVGVVVVVDVVVHKGFAVVVPDALVGITEHSQVGHYKRLYRKHPSVASPGGVTHAEDALAANTHLHPSHFT
jgi:hypothetical protein